MKTHKLGKSLRFRRRLGGNPKRPTMRRTLLGELLEQRTLLAADVTCGMTPLADQTMATILETQQAASSAIHVSEAGSTANTAYDAGNLTGSLSLNGSVGGWWDPSDVVKFTLESQAVVTIGLSGLRSDIDLSLYNSNGHRIGISDNAGSASESISQTLDAGVYYVLVAPWRYAVSTYVLSFDATATAPPETTTPPTTTPPTTTPPETTTPPSTTTPTSPVTAFPDVAYYGGANDWNLNSINAPEAWAQGYTGTGTIVAVVDTGVDLSNPELSSQIWVNAGEIPGNGIDDDHDGYVDDVNGWDFAANDNNPTDQNGHGTHVAGIIAADANGTGSTGVAPDATIMPVRVLDGSGSGTAAAVAAGIRYAVQHGADIINLSLGGSFSSVIQSAIQYAQQLSVLVVVAAGNEYASTPSYPARFSATLNNVISVGAYSSSDVHASFSNRVGSSGAVQVDAPGVNVYSTYLNNRYVRLSGTSMAAPHVAGLAALALSANPSLTAAELRNVIIDGANHTISGSDALGGINAAVTVALAAAGEVSSSPATSTAAATGSVATTARIRSRGISSTSLEILRPSQRIGTSMENVAYASLSPVATSVPEPTAWSAATQDDALLALYGSREGDAADDWNAAVLSSTTCGAGSQSADEETTDLAIQSLATDGWRWGDSWTEMLTGGVQGLSTSLRDGQLD